MYTSHSYKEISANGQLAKIIWSLLKPRLGCMDSELNKTGLMCKKNKQTKKNHHHNQCLPVCYEKCENQKSQNILTGALICKHA